MSMTVPVHGLVNLVANTSNRKLASCRGKLVPTATTYLGAADCLGCPFAPVAVDPDAALLSLPQEMLDDLASLDGSPCYAWAAPGTAKAPRFGVSAEEAFWEARFTVLPGTLFRHATGGNPHPEYVRQASRFHADRPDVMGGGFTHTWRRDDPGEVRGWTCLASVESEAEAVEAVALGWDPAITVSELDPLATGGQRTVAGRRAVRCPSQVRDDIGCADCLICFRPARDGWVRPVPVFTPHGASARSATAVVTHKRRSLDGVPVPYESRRRARKAVAA